LATASGNILILLIKRPFLPVHYSGVSGDLFATHKMQTKTQAEAQKSNRIVGS
jgi:hypothetical protein